MPLQIRNNGQVVEGYRFVIGAPAGWATVEPSASRSTPGRRRRRPSSSGRHARLAPRPARCRSAWWSADRAPRAAVVPEGVVEVLPFLETTAELVPRTSQGRRGRHQVAVDNRGNVPVNVLVDAAADGDRVRFRVDPVGLAILPGEARFVKVRVRPAARVWRGQPVTHPFVVQVAPQDSSPVELEGSWVQTPVVPKWLVWALLGLAPAGGAAGVVVHAAQADHRVAGRGGRRGVAAQAEDAAGEAKEAAEEAGGAATDAKQAADEAEASAGRPGRPNRGCDHRHQPAAQRHRRRTGLRHLRPRGTRRHLVAHRRRLQQPPGRLRARAADRRRRRPARARAGELPRPRLPLRLADRGDRRRHAAGAVPQPRRAPRRRRPTSLRRLGAARRRARQPRRGVRQVRPRPDAVAALEATPSEASTSA